MLRKNPTRAIGKRFRELCAVNSMSGAVADEAIAIIKEYKNHSEIINAHLPFQLPPIMLVYANDSPLNRTVARELLQSNCVVVTDKYFGGRTLLHVACERGDHATGIMLLAKNVIDANARTGKGWTALHLATTSNSEPLVSELIKDLALDVNAQLSSGMTALIMALKNDFAIARIILSHPNINVGAVFHDSKTNERTCALTTLVFDTNYTNRQLGAELLQTILCKPGVDVDFRFDGPNGKTLVCANGFFPSVEVELKQKSCPNSYNGSTALIIAAHSGFNEAVDVLLQRMPRLDIHNDAGRDAYSGAQEVIRSAITTESARRAACWERRKHTIFARTHAATFLYHNRYARDLTAFVVRGVYVDNAENNKLTDADRKQLDAHNREIVNHVYDKEINARKRR